MVLQVAPDASQFVLDGDTGGLQPFGITDTRQLQQLRRIDRAARQDDFPLRRDFHPFTGKVEFNTRRPAILQSDPARQRMGQYSDIVARHRRAQEGIGRAPSARPLDRGRTRIVSHR